LLLFYTYIVRLRQMKESFFFFESCCVVCFLYHASWRNR